MDTAFSYRAGSDFLLLNVVSLVSIHSGFLTRPYDYFVKNASSRLHDSVGTPKIWWPVSEVPGTIDEVVYVRGSVLLVAV